MAGQPQDTAALATHFFRDQAERNRKRVPHLMLVGNLRFSLPAILAWEIDNSVRGNATAAAVDEIVREQDAARFDSAP